MEHTELIGAIEVQILNAPLFALGGYIRFLHALRAVVELHKPVEIDWMDSPMCQHCEWDSYPCPTIQAIEKELQ